MPVGYQESTELACPACDVAFEASVWLILDAQEAPEAVVALRRGELNVVTCPSCGHRGPAGAPLLFHDAVRRRVIFAPAPGAPEYVWRDQARDLHALLVGSIAEEQRRPYLGEVDIVQDLAGIARLLERRERRPSESAPRPHPQVAGEAVAGHVAEATPGAVRPEDRPPLLVAVEAMLAANAPEEFEAVLASHPILLDPSSDLALAQLIEVALEQREFAIADGLRNARALLARLTEASRGQVAPPAPAPLLDELPDAAVQALLRARTEAELEAACVEHPALLRPETDGLLARRVDQALDEGNERLAHALEERREALARRHPAATTGAPVADAASLDEAIEALLVAEGEEALVEALDRYPVLLEEAAAEALWQFAAEARASGDEELARYAVACRELLRRVRADLEQ
ncbi:MAG: CpXC domain-containing protein [Chloroflexaceae bacterium]|nr:CpXC domain-containing protein [Chloroflexaceae bacterium]